MSMLPNDPAERPIEPQIDNPDIVRPAAEQPDDRSPRKIFLQIVILLIVVGGAYMALNHYWRI